MKTLRLRTKLLMVAGVLAACAAIAYAVTQTWVDGTVMAGVADNGVDGGGGGYRAYPNNGGALIEFVSDPNYLAQNPFPLNYTTGCAFNPAKDFLYTTEFSNGKLAVYTNVTPHALTTISTQRARPESIVFAKDGRFFVGGPDVPNFEEYDAAGNFVQLRTLTTPDVTADSTGGTDWIELAKDGKTMLITSEGTRIMRFDLQTNTQLSDFAALPSTSGAYALRMLADGGVLVANREMIRQLNSAGTQIATYDVTGQDHWFALNLDPDGIHFWSGDFATGKFFKFAIQNGTNFDNPVTTVDTGQPNKLFGLCIRGEITAAVPQGVFVIGDVEAHSLGLKVNFWGSQWWKNNDMSGTVSSGVASFKGWASSSDNFCGGTWISRPGNSSNPPDTITDPLTIVVTDSVVKNGPNISGTIKQILTVHPSAGYGPNPGHAGNGIVATVTCGQ